MASLHHKPALGLEGELLLDLGIRLAGLLLHGLREKAWFAVLVNVDPSSADDLSIFREVLDLVTGQDLHSAKLGPGIPFLLHRGLELLAIFFVEVLEGDLSRCGLSSEKAVCWRFRDREGVVFLLR